MIERDWNSPAHLFKRRECTFMEEDKRYGSHFSSGNDLLLRRYARFLLVILNS
jgi:hypothetical protein